ncbi:MAG TPA: arsenic resistance N-acetyltransferase ArsN2, partial [Acetobacteraceae bacterium]|nr:arsenic resistance N-acetyltransferase ArsN2 [Acetobacteraceae bacterium]
GRGPLRHGDPPSRVLRAETGAGARGSVLRGDMSAVCAAQGLRAERLSESEMPAFRRALTEALLPTDDLDRPGRHFFRFDAASGETLGYGGFELYASHVLLRSIVVLPRHRGHGIGERIVQELMAQAHGAGARQAYLLTTTAQSYFERLGFRSVDRASAPEAILATTQAEGLCPASAKLLTKMMIQ